MSLHSAIIAAAALAMPSGSLAGAWLAANVAGGRIPNSAVSRTTDPNLLSAARRQFTNVSLWSLGNCTAVDCNATAPDGSTEASTITAAVSSNWYVGSAIGVLPAGTYSFCGSILSVSGSANFKCQAGAGSTISGTMTATGSWSRFKYTFTTTSTTGNPRFQTNDATSASVFKICDFQLFAGSSDLNTNALTALPPVIANADLQMGAGVYDTSATVSGGAFHHGSKGHIQFPAVQNLSAFTFIYVAKKAATASFQPVVGQTDQGIAGWHLFSVGPDDTGILFNQVAIGIQPTPSTGASNPFTDGIYAKVGANYVVFVHRYGAGATATFVDNFKVLSATGLSPAIPATLKDLAVGFLQNSFTSGYDIAALYYYSRSLSDAEAQAAYLYLATKYTIQTPRTVIFTGSSYTAAGAYPGAVNTNATKPIQAINGGHGGWSLSNLISERSNVVSILNGFTVPGSQTKIVSVEAGVNEVPPATSFLTDLAAHCDALQAAGFKVLVHTILSHTNDGDGGTAFNAFRNAANPVIRTWVGVHCDAVADWAADPNWGTDAAPNSLTYWNADKLHPNNATQLLMAVVTAAALDTIP
jgi:hypothetical protein